MENDIGVIPIVILGHNRTMMTIENIKQFMSQLTYKNMRFIIGSDMSSPGHVQAVSYFLKSTGYAFDIIETHDGHSGLGAIMNMCFNKAIQYSDVFVYAENDMILHKDINILAYVDLIRNTQCGAINLKCSSQESGKYGVNVFSYHNENYIIPVPLIKNSHIATFGINVYSRKFISQMGDVIECKDTDEAETAFIEKYNSMFENGKRPSSYMVFDVSNYHADMNGKRGLFYHIGINCQHRAGVRWNPNIMPSQYHYLSDEDIDERFRSIFKPTQVQ